MKPVLTLALAGATVAAQRGHPAAQLSGPGTTTFVDVELQGGSAG